MPACYFLARYETYNASDNAVPPNSAETVRDESEPLDMSDRRAVVTPVQSVQALQLEYVDPVYLLKCSVEFGTPVGHSGDLIGEDLQPAEACPRRCRLRASLENIPTGPTREGRSSGSTVLQLWCAESRKRRTLNVSQG